MSKPRIQSRFGDAAHRLDQELKTTLGWSAAGPQTLYGLWLEPIPRPKSDKPPRIDIIGFLVTPRAGGNAHSAFPLGELPEAEARRLTEIYVSRGIELAAELRHIEIHSGQPVFTFIPLARA